MDSFIVSFANSDSCEGTVEIGRSIVFALMIKCLQKMGLPKKLNTIEKKVNDNKKIMVFDEMTLVFVTLSVKDSYKEKMLKRVYNVLKKIDYIEEYRRIVIDSLISFQIENFVKSQEEMDKLNEVVGMQMSVEELFVQAEREQVFDSGYKQGREKGIEEGREKGIEEGIEKGKDNIIRNMLEDSVDDEIILKFAKCSRQHLQELKRKMI